MDMDTDLEMLLSFWHLHLLNEEFLRDHEKRRGEREKMIRMMKRVAPPRYLFNAKIERQNEFVARLTNGNDVECFNNLRMHNEAFRTLCYKLENEVPQGKHYLCDGGYTNEEGFLRPYRSTQYHLKEWGPDTRCPQTPREVFNMRHSSARNIVERAFGILKVRFAVLRSPTFYPMETQNKIVMACTLLHNYIMFEQPNDPLVMVDMLDEDSADTNMHEAEEYIKTISSTPAWTQMRENLAGEMWTEYLNNQSRT